VASLFPLATVLDYSIDSVAFSKVLKGEALAAVNIQPDTTTSSTYNTSFIILQSYLEAFLWVPYHL
jgi:hypothetical protein